MRRLSVLLLFSLACLPRASKDLTPTRRPSSLLFSNSFGKSGSQLSQFRRPLGISRDGKGGMYLADCGNRRILRLDENGIVISEHTADMVGGLEEPRGVASDGFYVYVADYGKRQVVRVDPEKHLALVLLENPEGGFAPWGIEATPTGDLYVSDREKCQILIFDGMQRLRGSFGGYGGGPGEFRRPSGIAVDGMRRVYVCDPERRAIEVFDPLGGRLSSMRIKDPPLDLDLDAYGNLFVASPNRVLIVDQRGGEVLTVDGPRSPGGILVKDKRLFVTDPDLDRVLVFDIGYSEE